MAFSVRHLWLRSLWLKLHLCLALSVGLLFVLQGITGSLSVYRDEIDQLLNPQLAVEPVAGGYLSLDKILVAVRATEPERHGVWTLELPRKPDQSLTAWFEKPRETVDAFYAPLMLAINPYTGEVLDKRFWGQTATTWLLDLHSHLLLEAKGRQYLAILAVLMLFSVVSGLILWWPGWRQLPWHFRVRLSAPLSVMFTDLHRLLGLIAAPGLLLLACSGLHLAYPVLLETLTGSAGMGHGDEGPTVRSTAVPGDRPVSLTEAVLIARGPFSQSELRRISTPLGDTGTYKINFRQRHEVNQHHPVTTVWIDRWSGQIRDVRNPNKFSAGQRFSVWLWPLHTGEAFGELGRAIWFVTGLLPLILYVSGIWVYLAKRARRVKTA